MPPEPTIELVVFSDDWGRHPSSCQHLIRELLPKYPVWWVNTIGTRRVRFSPRELPRIAGKLKDWITPNKERLEWMRPFDVDLEQPRVLCPFMYPGHRRPWQRRFNQRRVTRAVGAVLGESAADTRRIAVTTLPTTADLVGWLDVDAWVYYCVDDFSVWPGSDNVVMEEMERSLVNEVDEIVCVSDVLATKLTPLVNLKPHVLTHGVDVDHFGRATRDTSAGDRMTGNAAMIGTSWQPIFTFWGLIDERLDAEFIKALLDELGDSYSKVKLYGQVKWISDRISGHRNLVSGWEEPYAFLPAAAAGSDVLIMPYIDAPVTRAMQPLKLKEYLATYKPVVVRDLPATRDWADCCDLASTANQFVELCMERAKTGLPADQREARERRLPGESWSEKARQFERILLEALDGR